MLQYEMYIVSQDPHYDCICRNFNTSQGDPACEHCLGTGHKVTIRKVKGVRQPETQDAFKINVDVEVGVYFFKNDVVPKEFDLIIWHNEIERITKVERFCSDAEKPVYYRCETRRVKTDTEIFLKNFCKAVGRTYKRRR